MQQENREYACYQELYQKRIDFLRDSARFIEQTRKMRSECRTSPYEFKHIIMRLKQNLVDVDAVKGKNEHLLHIVDDMLHRSQNQVESPFISLTNIGGHLNTMRSKEMMVEGSICCGSSCHIEKVETSTINASEEGNLDLAESSFKLQKLSCSDFEESQSQAGIKNNDCAIKGLVESVYNGTDKSRRMWNDTSLSELSVHNDVKLSEAKETQSICSSSAVLKFSESPSHVIANDGSAAQGATEHALKHDSHGYSVVHENHEQCLLPSLAEQHFTGKTIEDALSDSSKKHMEKSVKPQLRSLLLEKGKMNPGFVRNLGDGSEDVAVQSEALANDSDAEDKYIIKRLRAALSVIPSEEKLKILNNIYETIIEWDGTWKHRNDHVWNPYLVFSTLEAAKMGKEKVKEILGSKDGSPQSLICYEAICELIFSFPGENLLPTPFVQEYLLLFDTPRLLEQVKYNTLLSFQDADSTLFWGTLIDHAIYLAMHNLATVTQIASTFSGILLPVSRFKNLSKEEYKLARLSLNTFIAHLIGDKIEVSSLSYEQDCLKEADKLMSLNKHGATKVGLVRLVKDIEFAVNGETIDGSKSSSRLQNKMTPCISCRLILQVLFCNRSKWARAN